MIVATIVAILKRYRALSLIIENSEPRVGEASTSYCTTNFNFPFSSLFFTFPRSREDAIDATPVHKPPSGLSCFHKSALKQGADTSDAQHSPTQSHSLFLSFVHSFARCYCNFATPTIMWCTYVYTLTWLWLRLTAEHKTLQKLLFCTLPRNARLTSTKILLRGQLPIYCPESRHLWQSLFQIIIITIIILYLWRNFGDFFIIEKCM